MGLKQFILNFITIIALTMICHILDIFMEFYDYRFMIGVAVGAALFKPVNVFLKSKLKFLN